jgi:hypothetical protein
METCDGIDFIAARQKQDLGSPTKQRSHICFVLRAQVHRSWPCSQHRSSAGEAWEFSGFATDRHAVVLQAALAAVLKACRNTGRACGVDEAERGRRSLGCTSLVSWKSALLTTAAEPVDVNLDVGSARTVVDIPLMG